MTVYKRGRSWALLVDLGPGSDGRRRRHYEGGFSTKRQAREAELEIRSRLTSGTYVDRSSKTVASYFEDWLRTQYDLRPTTLASYAANVRNHIIPRLGPMRLQDLRTSDLNDLFADLLVFGRVKVGKQRGGALSPRTVRYVAVIVRKALQDAMEAGLIDRNVADAARKPKQKPSSTSTMTTWSSEEVWRFLQATKNDRLWALWVMYLTTGLRRGEALGLHWEDVDLDRATASIRRTLIVVNRVPEEGIPKSGNGRLISLSAPTVEALRGWRRCQLEERLEWGDAWTHNDLVFTNEGGSNLHPDRITDRFRRRQREVGLPKMRLHGARHTFATIALHAGVPMKVVSEALGHSSIKVTADVYSHVSPGMSAQAVETVANEMFGGY